MKFILFYPILIPLLTAIVSMLVWNRRPWQRGLGVLGAATHLGIGLKLLDLVWTQGIQSVQAGAWAAPFGITLAADLLSAIMIVLTGLMGLAVAVYSLANIDPRRESFAYYPLFHILLMGVSGAFLTGDLFNMYVWFEVMLIASFVLLALGGEQGQLEGAIKYVTLNLMSSALFLAAVGILYSITGRLNMADLALALQNPARPGLVLALALMFLLAYGIKAAVFPLFFWLPASYHTPPAAVSAIFAGLLTKVGVYSLIRVFTLIFVSDVPFTHNLILIVAGLTMLSGVLGAASQYEFRRILSFHIVSQIGYMIMGLGLYSPLALAGSIFYIAHHIIVKTNLFLVSGLVNRLEGTYQLRQLGGLYRRYPLVGALFLIPALSLAGVPPLSGFWAKFILIRAGLEEPGWRGWAIVAVALLTGLLTLFSMMKIWAEAFWKEKPESWTFGTAPEAARMDRASWALYLAPIAALALLTVLIGLAVQPLMNLSLRAAGQLLDNREYIRVVLGDAYVQAAMKGRP